MSRDITRLFESNRAKNINRARNVVLAKGVFDVFLSLSIIFFPALIYDGVVPAAVSKLTGLQFIYRDADPGGAYGLAALIMGCAFAGISAGMSDQEDAHKTVATLNGMFAYFGLLGCLFSPKRFGSSALLLASLQDVLWFWLIINAGGYTAGETLGMKNAAERLKAKKREIQAEQEQHREHEEQQQQQQQKYGDEKRGGTAGGEKRSGTSGESRGSYERDTGTGTGTGTTGGRIRAAGEQAAAVSPGVRTGYGHE